MSVDLRAKLLAMRPEEVRLKPSADLPRVWAAMMEWQVSKAVVTLVAVADGTTSLYFTSGGGVIGGGEHDTVHTASRAWLAAVDKFVEAGAFVDQQSPIATVASATSFAALTYGGLKGARDTDARLRSKTSPIWPIYWLGQDVVTKLRETSERQQRR